MGEFKEIDPFMLAYDNKIIADVIEKYFLSGEWKGLGLGKIQKHLTQEIETVLTKEFTLNIQSNKGGILELEVKTENNPILQVTLDKAKL